MNLDNITKYQKLAICILFDAMGFVSIIFPPFDFVWAPASAYLMTKLYEGKSGKIAAAVSFIEEAMPMLDVIPTFSLMWLYTYVFKSKKSETIIDVDAD
jgi:hypothetical protein